MALLRASKKSGPNLERPRFASKNAWRYWLTARSTPAMTASWCDCSRIHRNCRQAANVDIDARAGRGVYRREVMSLALSDWVSARPQRPRHRSNRRWQIVACLYPGAARLPAWILGDPSACTPACRRNRASGTAMQNSKATKEVPCRKTMIVLKTSSKFKCQIVHTHIRIISYCSW